MADTPPDPNAEAARRLEDALAETGARDPRAFYRERLKELKAEAPEAYARMVAYYRERLIPEVAGGSDPLAAWVEYGRLLAAAFAPGRCVRVDPEGRAHPYEPGGALHDLVLHLPDDGGRALLVSLPPELSPAQRATYAVLVAGRQKLEGAAAQSSTM